MGRTKEEIIEILSREHRELLNKFSSKEKLLESIREEALLSEFLTVSKTEKGLLASDNYRHMLLWMDEQDDGGIELAWAEKGRPIHFRKVYDNPSEGYIEFSGFLSYSKQYREKAMTKTARHGKAFKSLLERYFGKKQ